MQYTCSLGILCEGTSRANMSSLPYCQYIVTYFLSNFCHYHLQNASFEMMLLLTHYSLVYHLKSSVLRRYPILDGTRSDQRNWSWIQVRYLEYRLYCFWNGNNKTPMVWKLLLRIVALNTVVYFCARGIWLCFSTLLLGILALWLETLASHILKMICSISFEFLVCTKCVASPPSDWSIFGHLWIWNGCNNIAKCRLRSQKSLH